MFLRDIRFGIRNLMRTRAFSAIALGSLALGIGGSTAMYSVIHAVILEPFPYRDIDRLVTIGYQAPDQRGFGGYYETGQFLDLAERTTAFQGVIASTISDVTWTGGGDPQRLRGNHCTINTFEIMGVPPLLGRTTSVADGAPGAEPVAVLGYKFWQREFGGDPGVLGRKLRLNDKVRTVVGVMPQRFMWRGADVYLPTVFRRGEVTEGVQYVHALARLKPGVTIPQGEADIRPVLEDLARQQPAAFPRQWRPVLKTFKETFPSGIQEALWILFGAVGLLLLIACVNVSNLLVSRAAYRRREIAIRVSLGASRFRLVSQLMAESLVLGIAGGMLGVAAAYGGLKGIIALVPPNTIPDEAHITLNGPVLLFTLGVSLAAALLFGLVPALQLSARDIVTPLKEFGRGTAGSRGQRILRSVLVAGEVALSLMLMVGASLMVRTLIAIQSVDAGANPERVLTMRMPFSRQRGLAPNRSEFTREVLRRVESIPGVAAVGINSALPPIFAAGFPVEIPGSQPDNRAVIVHQTNHAFDKAAGVAIVRGRFLSEQDTASRAHYAVVNQAFVNRYFGGGEALGRTVRIPRIRTYTEDLFEIVGVAKDRVNRVSVGETAPEIFIPYTLTGMADRLMILCNVKPAALDKAVRAQVYAVDAGQPVMDVKPLDAALNEYIYARPRFNLFLFSVFAGLGLTLALFGVYGVISNTVAQQTREIGIRIALGASFGQVIRMVLRLGAKLLTVGVLAGLGGSLASVKLLAGLVRNVSTFDLYSFAAVTAVVFATGLFATFWPARRAARVDPVTALRDE